MNSKGDILTEEVS